MRTRRRRTRRSFAAAVLATLLVGTSGPAAALAVPADSAYPRPVPETQGPTPSKPGDTPAEFGKDVVVPVAKSGDTPADFPGASRAPEPVPGPTTIEVVRPERTIVRDTDPILPIALAGLALLVAFGAAGAALRPHFGRTA
jgi:hypothetical protein